MASSVVFQVYDGGSLRQIQHKKTSLSYRAIMAVFVAERQTEAGNYVEQVTMTNSVTFQVCDGGIFRQIQLKKTSPAYRAIMAVFEAERQSQLGKHVQKTQKIEETVRQ
ncbi:hypothetical protein AAVH_14519 [Aphelenchoides avenae]|nr:hypothetical protein AAVH_14519 [Aphelenchus avenae]